MKTYKKLTLKNGETLTLAFPTMKDLSKIAEYYNKLFNETDNFSWDTSKEYTEQNATYYVNAYSNSGLMAILNGKMVGHANISLMSKDKRTAHRCDLGIGILKEHWGKGIAGKLMNAMFEIAKNLNCEQIELGVFSNNTRAKNLYKSFGFEKTGTKKHYFKLADGKYKDIITMIKFI